MLFFSIGTNSAVVKLGIPVIFCVGFLQPFTCKNLLNSVPPPKKKILSKALTD
jgi:hypothetical protein